MQAVARYGAGFVVILGDVNRPTRGTNPPSYVQAVEILSFITTSPLGFAARRPRIRLPSCPNTSPRSLRYDFALHSLHRIHQKGIRQHPVPDGDGIWLIAADLRTTEVTHNLLRTFADRVR